MEAMWQYIGAGVLLTASAWQDWKMKKVSMYWLMLHILIGIAGHLARKSISWALFAAMMPGIALLGIARLTGQKIGKGDGWLVTALGIYIGFWDTVAILLGAFALSSLCGIILLLRKKISLQGELAFAPFVLIGFVLFMAGVRGGGYA